MAAPAGQRPTRKDLALAAGALALIAAVAALRLHILAAAPITDPLEAREFQLARILVAEGWLAFARAADPAETARLGGVLPVALAGWIAGFDALLPLRLPGWAALLLAAAAAGRAGFVLTGRRGPALVSAAALIAAPSAGLIALSATADALALLFLAAITACLAQLLRWGGDSRVAMARGKPHDEVLYLPPGDLRADRPEARTDPDAAAHGARRAARRDARARALLWVLLGLSAPVAGGALAAFALLAIAASHLVLRTPLASRHPGAPRWVPGRTATALGLPVAAALALLPGVLHGLARGSLDVAGLMALLAPRPDPGAYPAALPGAAGLLALLWPLATLAPLWLLSRVHFGAARESVLVLLVLGWVPAWLVLSPAPALALVFGTAGLAMAAGLLVNYWIECERRPPMPVLPGKATDIVPLISAGLAGAGAVALIALAFDASDGSDTVLVLLLAAILMLLPLAWFAIEQSASGLALSGLALAALLEWTAGAFLLPAAHATWPGWRTAAILAPLRTCGARAIRDETGFDPGFLHHAGPGASGPGMAPPGLPALRIRAAPELPGPGWVAVARIGYTLPDGTPQTAHVFADPDARPERAAGEGWRACLRALALRD